MCSDWVIDENLIELVYKGVGKQSKHCAHQPGAVNHSLALRERAVQSCHLQWRDTANCIQLREGAWDEHADLMLLSPMSQPQWKPEGKEACWCNCKKSEKECSGKVGGKPGKGGVPGYQGANGEEVRREPVTESDNLRLQMSLDEESSVGWWDQELG